MYCSRCGAKLPEGSEFCSECGNSLKGTTQNKVKINSGSSIGWGVLGFFFPVVGLILYLVWKDERPSDSKAAGIGALILVCFYVVLIIFAFLMAFISAATY